MNELLGGPNIRISYWALRNCSWVAMWLSTIRIPYIWVQDQPFVDWGSAWAWVNQIKCPVTRKGCAIDLVCQKISLENPSANHQLKSTSWSNEISYTSDCTKRKRRNCKPAYRPILKQANQMRKGGPIISLASPKTGDFNTGTGLPGCITLGAVKHSFERSRQLSSWRHLPLGVP